jgi:hypothetical protein
VIYSCVQNPLGKFDQNMILNPNPNPNGTGQSGTYINPRQPGTCPKIVRFAHTFHFFWKMASKKKRRAREQK